MDLHHLTGRGQARWDYHSLLADTHPAGGRSRFRPADDGTTVQVADIVAKACRCGSRLVAPLAPRTLATECSVSIESGGGEEVAS